MTSSSHGGNLPESPIELARLLEAVTEQLSTVGLTAMSDAESVEVVKTIERAHNKGVAVAARAALEVSDRSAFAAAGYVDIYPFLMQGLRLGQGETARRMTQLRSLARTTNLQGEQLAPKLPATAAAVAEGAITAGHVSVIAKVMRKVPHSVAPEAVERAEANLADVARRLTPEDTARAGDRILAYLDPDGQITDDKDRQRQRGFTVLPQDQQLMSKIRGRLTPELRSKLEVILTQWAKPGMNNPQDPESPAGAADASDLDPDKVAAARDRDTRSQSQRNHDALIALCDFVLGNKALGQPDRLPSEIVVTTTLSELAANAGFASTSTGTHLTIQDLVNVAADAHWHLAVFKDHSAEILYLARGSRFANKAQRLAIFARDRGCTSPGCGLPFSRIEAHHMPDWVDGGLTDIDHLGAACGKHNRSVGDKPGQWETTILSDGPDAGRVGWRPTGSDQPYQVNPIHHAYLGVTAPARPADSDRQRRPRAAPGRHHAHRSTVEARLRLAAIARRYQPDIFVPEYSTSTT